MSTVRRSRFGSGISTIANTFAAVEEACAQALATLDGGRPDLAVVFATPGHSREVEDLGARLAARLKARTLIGCTAEAVIGGGREVEEGPALSIFVARLEGVEVRPFTLPAQDSEEAPIEAWRTALPVQEGEKGIALVFADPFTVDVNALLGFANDEWPDLPLAGGIASGAGKPGGNRLYADEEVLDGGAVGAFLVGADVRTVVSQGCRPIGKHLVITKAKGNVIEQIGGKPALAVLRDVIGALDEKDQTLAARSLHVGRVIDEARDSFGRGDFLIRNPIGANPKTGALAVADQFRAGQTIQFHVRDAAAAAEDLRHLLGDTREGHAALLFSCNGRGKRFFGAPDHDSNLIREKVGLVPVAGFFCGGEVGPVGRRNFLHGFTSSLVIF